MDGVRRSPDTDQYVFSSYVAETSLILGKYCCYSVVIIVTVITIFWLFFGCGMLKQTLSVALC